MYVLLFIFLTMLTTLLESVTWPTDRWTKNLQGACNNVICKECVTELFSVESSDMFEAVGLLKILALSALATRHLC